MSQRKDKLKNIDSAALSIKGWIDIRAQKQTIPTTSRWLHEWDQQEFNRIRNICCKHLGLDWDIPEQRSKCHF